MVDEKPIFILIRTSKQPFVCNGCHSNAEPCINIPLMCNRSLHRRVAYTLMSAFHAGWFNVIALSMLAVSKAVTIYYKTVAITLAIVS